MQFNCSWDTVWKVTIVLYCKFIGCLMNGCGSSQIHDRKLQTQFKDLLRYLGTATLIWEPPIWFKNRGYDCEYDLGTSVIQNMVPELWTQFRNCKVWFEKVTTELSQNSSFDCYWSLLQFSKCVYGSQITFTVLESHFTVLKSHWKSSNWICDGIIVYSRATVNGCCAALSVDFENTCCSSLVQLALKFFYHLSTFLLIQCSSPLLRGNCNSQ